MLVTPAVWKLGKLNKDVMYHRRTVQGREGVKLKSVLGKHIEVNNHG